MTHASPSTRSSAGFTLIELMIVIAIIAIIAAIAIPNLVSARKSANETAAIGLLRAVHSAQAMFKDRDHDRDGRHQYARHGGDLKGLVSLAGLDDSVTNGYHWGVLDDANEPADVAYFVIAAPAAPMRSGDRLFTIDETGVIRWLSAEGFSPQSFEYTYQYLRSWQPLL